MSGGIEDLKAELRIDYDKSLAGLQDVAKTLDQTRYRLSELVPAYDRLNQATVALATSGQLPVKWSEMLLAKVGSVNNTVTRLTGQVDTLGQRIQSALVDPSTGLAAQWDSVRKQVMGTRSQMTGLVSQMRLGADATATMVVNTANLQAAQSQPQKQQPGGGLMQLAGIGLAVKGLTRIAAVSMQSAKSIRIMAAANQQAIGTMSRFRMALAAPKANPELNVVRKSLESVGETAAHTVKKITGVADAILSDLTGSASAGVKSMGQINSALDETSLVMAKHVSKLDTLQSGMTLLAKVFPFAASKIDQFRQPIDSAAEKVRSFVSTVEAANTQIGQSASDIRGKVYVMTGVWNELQGSASNVHGLAAGTTQLAASADLFATAQYHALLPSRLMVRELEGAQRIVKIAKTGFAAVTSPIWKLSVMTKLANAQIRHMGDLMPKTQQSLFRASGAAKLTSSAFEKMRSVVEQIRPKTTELSAGSSRFSDVVRMLKTKVDSLQQSMKASASQQFPALRSAMQQGAAAAQILSTGYSKLGKDIDEKLTPKLKKSSAAVRQYVAGLELGIRAQRAFSTTTFLTATSFGVMRKLAYPLTLALGKLARGSVNTETGVRQISPAGKAASFVLKGVTRAANGTFQSLNGASSAARKATASFGSMSFSSMASSASSALTSVKALAAGSIVLAGSFAMATEKNQAVFGVMLHDMDQGRAVVADLQSSKAIGLFDNDEVLNSGRLLFKAGVAATGLKGKTEQLATIAAATSTELSDLTRIYQQGANRGSFGQDKINQMAERGIDIYGALESVTGKSGDALSKMVSDGQIGVTEMDAALSHLTTGTGIYAGALDVLGNTTGGMLSTIKNNFLQAFGAIGSIGNEAFRPILLEATVMSQGMSTLLLKLSPIAVQVFQTINAAASIAWGGVKWLFESMFGGAVSTFQGMLGATMQWVTKFRWFFENLVPIAQFAAIGMARWIIGGLMDIAFWFTDKLPAYLTWFSQNWIQIFRDIAVGTGTIIANIAKNIGSAMEQIWLFIKSGGMQGLEFAWTPILDGFQATVSKLPEVGERALSELENGFDSQLQDIGTTLANRFDELNMKATAALEVKPPEMPEIKDIAGEKTKIMGDEGGVGGTGNKRTSFVNEAISARSVEGLKIALGTGQNTGTKQVSLLTKAVKSLSVLEQKAKKNQPMVAPQGAVG